MLLILIHTTFHPDCLMQIGTFYTMLTGCLWEGDRVWYAAALYVFTP